MNRWLFTILMALALPQMAMAQDRKIDQLEVLYSQQHYTKVIRKANKLLAIPDYDYSGMPTFYKSIATFRLLTDEKWTNRHQTGLTDAIKLYDDFLAHSKAQIYIQSHYFEIAELKQYLIDLERTYKGKKQTQAAKKIADFTEIQLKGIQPNRVNFGKPSAPKGSKTKEEPLVTNTPSKTAQPSKTANTHSSNREEIVTYAMQYIGTPYQWAGQTPEGFDCSGYIGYIYNKHGISVPRSAAAQKEHAQKLKDNEATKGDLVFFKTGSKITHVGIVISEAGEPLKMIHSSTSKGIITTDVHNSTYWSKKYAGVGRIVE